MRPFLAVLLALALAAPAVAATPAPGGRYQGTTSQGGDVSLKMSKGAGRIDTLRIPWRTRRCGVATRDGVRGTARYRHVPVHGGRFARRRTETARLPAAGVFTGGTQTERYRLRGRFTSRTRVVGTLQVEVIVRNRAGAQIDRCTLRRAIRFSGRLIGVDGEGEYTLP